MFLALKPTTIYPSSVIQKLGFDNILEQLKNQCQSKLGKYQASKTQIISDVHSISTWHIQAKEFYHWIIDESSSSPTTEFLLLKEELSRLEVPGATLTVDQILAIQAFLDLFSQFLKAIKGVAKEYPELYDLSQSYVYHREIKAGIDAIFNPKGEIRKEVSPLLNSIRAEIKKAKAIQDRKFESLLRHCKEKKWLSDEEQTIRNGRRVLAFLAEHKRKVKGIIHDESHTGKTTFIEPQSLVELGNDLFDLLQKERKEIFRILTELSNEIRPFHASLVQYQLLAGEFDFIKAKALFAIQMNASWPQIKTQPSVNLREARHPILQSSLKEKNREIVPLSLRLSEQQRVLMISGPNAGGKSICLKTLGLLQLMFQAGIPITADEKSEFSVFDNIFLDMGDDQNMENDLSTYSSHIQSLAHFTKHANNRTLFLLDEFGTGTDPQFGGAIAEGVLDHLVYKKAFGMATTHYSNLKIYAENKPGIANASMLFDQEEMQPSYQLQVGKPGSSYAFEIAKRIGLDKSIIDYANDRIGGKAFSYEKLVNQLEKEKIVLEKRLKSAGEKESKYQTLLEEYRALKEKAKTEKQRMALTYKTQLQNELKNVNKKFERSLAELKSSNKSQEQIAKEIREKLKKGHKKVGEEIEEIKVKHLKSPQKKDSFEVGDMVRLPQGSEVGTISEIKGKHAIVVFNLLKTKVLLSELISAEEDAPVPKKRKGVKVHNYSVDFKTEIDIRGQRANDAIESVDKFIDGALVLNLSSLKIIHGKGNGILRKLIAQYLKQKPEVVSFEYENEDFGGDGITIIKM